MDEWVMRYAFVIVVVIALIALVAVSMLLNQ